jgi:GNAT superfamily N-acetyltransferase
MDDFKIEPFDRAKHERAAFRCGQPSLDGFLHTLVTQYEKRRLGKTFVAVRPGNPNVLGYYTLASSAVAFANLPKEAARKLPKHPAPVILLARLAVDQSLQGQGLGETLLMDALERSLELSKSLGVFAIEVLAIDAGAASFYGKYGFTSLLDDPLHMYLPMSAIEDAAQHREPKNNEG